MALIREERPKTLDLGSGGSGPLIQLAVMKEFLTGLRPQTVLWFYWEGNDLSDLDHESREFPTLFSYLESDFHQNLADNQEAIDRALLKLTKGETDPLGGTFGLSFRRVVTLANLRHRLVFAVNGVKNCRRDQDATIELFDRIMRDGNDFINSIGCDLYLVYLPSWVRYGDPGRSCYNNSGNDDRKKREQVLAIAEAAGLTTIDVADAFDAHPDPLSLFPFMLNNHFNGDGYKLVADTVLQALAEDR